MEPGARALLHANQPSLRLPAALPPSSRRPPPRPSSRPRRCRRRRPLPAPSLSRASFPPLPRGIRPRPSWAGAPARAPRRLLPPGGPAHSPARLPGSAARARVLRPASGRRGRGPACSRPPASCRGKGTRRTASGSPSKIGGREGQPGVRRDRAHPGKGGPGPAAAPPAGPRGPLPHGRARAAPSEVSQLEPRRAQPPSSPPGPHLFVHDLNKHSGKTD